MAKNLLNSNYFKNVIDKEEKKSAIEKSVVSKKNTTKKETTTKKKEAQKRAKESKKVHTQATKSDLFTPEEKRVSAQVAKISNQTVRNSVDNAFKTPTQRSTPSIAGTIPGATVKNESSVLFQNPVENIMNLGESLGVEKVKPTKTGYEGLDYNTLTKLYGMTFEDERDGYITLDEGKRRRETIDIYRAQVATGDDLVKFIAEKTAQRDENAETSKLAQTIGTNNARNMQAVKTTPELFNIANSAGDKADFYSDIVAIAKDKQTRDNAQKKKEDSYYSYGSYAVENGATDTKYHPTGMTLEKYDIINKANIKGEKNNIYGFMTTEELNLYNALYNGGDKEKSDEFLESIKGDLQIRMSDYQTKRASEYGEKHPYSAGLESAVTSVVGGIPAALDNIGEFLFKGEVDTYDSTSRFMRNSQAYRQGGSEYMRNHHGEAGEFFYNTGVSMAEFGLNLLIGKGLGSLASGVGASANTAGNIASKAMTINMGANAASNAMTDIADRGGESWQVVTGGIAAGLAEYVFEKVSIDNLFNSKTAGTVAKDFKGYAMNAFKNIPRVAGQMVTEGSEELFTSAANLVSDAIIMQSRSENAIKRQEYIKQGMSIEEASKQVFVDTVKQLALDTLGGMVSGSVMGGANLAMQDISHTKYMTSVGENMLKSPAVMSEVVAMGLENNNAEAVAFEKKVKSGETVTGAEAGRVIESVLTENIREDGGIMNIAKNIVTLQGGNIRSQQELFDTAKAVMHLATGDATETDEALISRSPGAMTLLSAVEGDNKAISSIKNAAEVELRESSQMQNSEGKVQSEILRFAQNDGGVMQNVGGQSGVQMQNAEYGVRSEKAFEGIKYRVGYTDKNNPVVMLEEDIFEGKEGKKHDIVADYIAEQVGKYFAIVESGQKVYIGEDLPNEFTQSEYTKKLLKNKERFLKAKNRTVQNFGEIIEIATERKWEKVKHADKHSTDAKYGFYKYRSRIAVPKYDSAKNIVDSYLYDVELLIRNDADGKKYLYDIQDIQEIKKSDEQLSSTWGSKLDRSRPSPSTTRVSQSEDSVKSNSMRDGYIYSQGEKINIPENAKVSDKIIITEESEKFRKRDPKEYKIIKTMAKDLNMKVMFVDGITNSKGETVEGIITSQGIFINARVKNPTQFVATHEFSHRIEDVAPKAWEKYKNYVIEKLKNTPSDENGVSEYEKRYETKKEHYDDNDIDDEIACDYLGTDILNDVNELRSLIKHNGKLANTVRNVWNWVCDRLGLDVEKRKAAELWREAYKEASQNNQKTFEGQSEKIKESANTESVAGTRLSEYEGGERQFRPSTETGWLSQQWIAERSADNQAVAKPLTEISRIVTEELNVPVTRRNFADAGVSGSYNLTSEAIHTRAANDIVTLSHEVGHHLDKVLNMQELDGFDKVVDNFSKTLVALGYEENAKKTEAVGEFIRMYLTNKDVAKNFAPEYYEAFETALKEKGYDKSIGKLADAVNAYLSSSVSERIDLAISETDGRGKLQKLKEDGIRKEFEEKKTMFTELFDNINQNFIDSFYAIGKAQTRLYVDTKDGKQDAHLLATNSLNSAARSAYILTKKLTNVDGEEIGMSFIDSISPIYDKNPKQKKKNISNLNRYLVLKHALEWIAPTSENVKKKRVFSDERLENPEVLRQEIAKIEAELPAVKQAAENIYQYLRNLKKYWGVDTGLMTSELSKQLDEMYPNYVPFYRQSDKRGSMGARVNLANQRAPILEASGGSDMIVNPLESIINLTEKYVKTSSRNMAMQALAYMADNIEGSGFIIERVSEAKQQELVGGDKLYQNESNQAFATPDELKKITTEEDVWKKEFINGIGYVSVLIDGEKVWYQINDKRLFNAVADMTPQQLSLISRVLAPFMQLKRALITSNNPLFATTNAVRDAINAYHNSDINNPIEYLGAYFTAFKHVLQRDPNYERWCAMGGGHSSEISANMNSVNRALGKAMRTSTVNKVMYSILHPIEFVASINDIVESVPRLMAFEDEMKRTGDVHRAINKADDITTNFKRGGRKAKNYNNIFIFSNAQIQGLDRTRRSFTQSDVENGIRNRVIKYAVEAVLLAALQAWWNRRDEETEEDYKNLSKYMKRSQYVINISGGKFLRFPTAREQDLLRVIITDAIDMAFGDKESFDGLLGFVADAFIPPYIEFPTNTKGRTMTDIIIEMSANTFRNTPIGTFTDLMANKNFTGTNVIPEYLQDELPENQYNEKTSKLAVFLGKISKDSPMKIDYIINNNLGILGTLNKSLFPMDSSQVDKSLGFKSRWVADSYYSTDVLNEVYDMRDAAEIKMKRDKTGETVAEYEKINAVTTFISQYNNSIKGLPDPEKRAARKELLTIINTWGNEPSAVNGELIRLYNSTGENLFMQMPKIEVYTESGKRNMTPEEYVDCVTKYTAGFEATVSEVISSKEYKNADDEKKVDMIEDASKYALSAAKADTIPDATMTKWEQRIVEGKDNLSEVASERADSEKRKDFKADWKKENFEYDSSKYTDEELSKIETVESDAAGYYEAKANGGDVNNNDYRHIRVYESQLEKEMPIEEYAEVRAKAKTEGARLDPDGSDKNLAKRELYDYLETTDYSSAVKAALFEAIGNKGWKNPYTGKKIQ